MLEEHAVFAADCPQGYPDTLAKAASGFALDRGRGRLWARHAPPRTGKVVGRALVHCLVAHLGRLGQGAWFKLRKPPPSHAATGEMEPPNEKIPKARDHQ